MDFRLHTTITEFVKHKEKKEKGKKPKMIIIIVFVNNLVSQITCNFKYAMVKKNS